MTAMLSRLQCVNTLPATNVCTWHLQRCTVPILSNGIAAKYFPSYLIDRIHYDDVIMSLMASQITSLTIVYSTSYSGVDQRKHQSSASLAFVRGIHRGPVNSPHKRSVTRKMFPFDDVIMYEEKVFCQ